MKIFDLRMLAVSTILVCALSGFSATASAGGFSFDFSSWFARWRPNAAPSIAGSPQTSVQTGGHYQFTPVATDPDSSTLTFSISNAPSWANFNTSTGTLSGTAGTSGTYSNIVIRVSDGRSSASLPAFSIKVTGGSNRAPVIGGAPATGATVGVAYAFTPNASDPDGNALTFSIANKPSWASFNSGTGQLSGTPTAAGTHSNIIITVSDGKVSASLAAFTIYVAAGANHAPTISGTPASKVTTGSAYSFTPSASDSDHDTLAFAVTGKPAWASFSTATGKLNGTPSASQAGTYLNIVISVSDGKASSALGAFAITVAQPAASGTATLSWTVPTQNTDGSKLTDLAGYHVYEGLSPDSLNEVTELSSAGTTTYTFNQLASGTHYFAVSAYNDSGVESALSGVGSKTIM